MIYDRYSQEVERLTAKYANNPNALYYAWGYGECHSPLFDACGQDREGQVMESGVYSTPTCGCLTQVKRWMPAATRELTEAIRSDERIPDHETLIKPEHLPVFAEWQRKIDLAIGRTPPAMLEQ